MKHEKSFGGGNRYTECVSIYSLHGESAKPYFTQFKKIIACDTKVFLLRCHVTTFPISRHHSQIIFSHTGRSSKVSSLLDIPWFVSGVITTLYLTWRIAERSSEQRNFQQFPKISFNLCFDLRWNPRSMQLFTTKYISAKSFLERIVFLICQCDISRLRVNFISICHLGSPDWCFDKANVIREKVPCAIQMRSKIEKLISELVLWSIYDTLRGPKKIPMALMITFT